MMRRWTGWKTINCMCATTLPSMTCFICTGAAGFPKPPQFLGSMINIKPVLHVDDAGHLVAVGKVRGRKKSLTALVDAMEKQIGSWRDKNPVVFISHGDCEEDALFVRDLVESRFWHSRIPDQYHRPHHRNPFRPRHRGSLLYGRCALTEFGRVL